MNALRYLPFARRGVLRSTQAPMHLTLFVTGVCNARCRHCFHWREVEAGVSGPSLDEVQKLGQSVAGMGPLLWLSFGGGEPFLRSDLPQLAEAFAPAAPRHLAIPTNGLVEKRQIQHCEGILEALPETYLSVAVSFDGPPDIHDAIRQVPGGHARSMQSVRDLKALKGERFGVGLILTVTRENQHVLSDHMEELVAELKPDNVTINLARGESAPDESLLEVDIARYVEVCERKERLVREGTLPYFDFPLARLATARDRIMTGRVARQARGERQAHLSCSAGTLSATIFENGSVHPCEILGQEIGRLDEHDWDLSKLWNSAQADALRKKIKDTRCDCTFECVQADNVLFSAKTWPALALETLRGR